MNCALFKFRMIGLLVLVLLVPEAHAQQSNRFLHWSYRDVGRVARQVLPQAPVYAILGTAALVTTMNLDEPFQDEVRETYTNTPFLQSYFNVTNELGGPLMLFPATGLFTVSLLTENTRFQDAAFTSLQSWVYAGSMTFGLKRAFGRMRPEEGMGASIFRPLSRHTSFPSGHTTAVFALITPWVLYYPNPVTYGLFALGTSTAIARMALNKHWPTDVLAGAAIGFFTGRFLARMHLRESVGSAINLTRLRMQTHIAPNGFVLALNW
ncbi:MAG: phosphatase PAP2 family protein [Bacteroidota bacterium]